MTKLIDYVRENQPALSVAGFPGVVVVTDQTSGTIKIYAGTDADAAAYMPEGGLNVDAHFVLTPTTAGGAQFGE